MGAEVVTVVVLGVGLVGVAVGLWLWKYILEWARRALVRWLNEIHLERLVGLVKEAYIAIDKVVSFTKEQAERVIAAWKKLRRSLLKHTTAVELDPNSGLVKQKTVVWMIDEELERGTVRRTTIEEAVDWHTLPQEARVQLMGSGAYEIDLTKTQDQKIEQLATAQ